MPIPSGTRLGSYEIVDAIGEGGMGEVYRARDPRLQREIAIKVLPALFSADADRISRFEREAMAASALNHPNILHIYDIGESAGVHYIAMELVDGDTLRRRMLAGIERHDAIDWTAQAADALAKAHASGIVHRDLKPENVMVTRDGYVKVVDFGLAKLVETRRDVEAQTATREEVSRDGMVLGTVGYMSPEQAQGLPVDHRSDVFSLGCVLHEMLSGTAPFSGKSPIDTQHRIIYADPHPLPPSIDAHLRRIVERCLVKEPDRRYGAIREMAEELRALSGTRGPAVPSATATASRSIAVLPFDDLSAAKDHGYLGTGVAEEIITDLSSVDGLQVVARASAATFAGTDQPIPAVARALGVEYIVTGSVRRAGDRLRISAQLLHASRDLTLWAQKFDGTMDDIFDIQETVARAIAGQLRLQLSSAASGRIRQRPIENVRAYECYLRARSHLYTFTAEALAAAESEIDRALEIAGPNAVLFTTKGLIHWQCFNSGVNPDAVLLDRAETLAREALLIDRDSAGAEMLLGLVCIHRARPSEAMRHLETALHRDPNDPDATGWLFALRLLTGRDDEARLLSARLAVIDPLGWMTRLSKPMMAMGDGKFEQGLEYMAEIEERSGFETLVRVILLILSRRFAEAQAVADELLRRVPDDPFARIAAMFRFAVSGDTAKVDELFTDPVVTVARNDLQYSVWIAEVFALLGDAERAAEWLRHGMSRGYLAYPYLSRHDWLFDRVRTAAPVAEAFEELRLAWLSSRHRAT